MADKNPKFALGRKNIIMMLIGVGILILGFFIMSIDNEPYGFGFLGLTLGPIVVMIGFLFQFVAILYKEKKSE